MRVMPPTRTTSSISPAVDAGILERLPCTGSIGALDQVVDQALELGAGQLHRQVLRTGGIRRDEGQVDFGLLRGRQLDLGLFGSFLEALQSELVVLQVDALVLLELAARYSTRRMSKSSPPRKVSPLVDFTSKTPSPISRTEMSKVPPPRS
jgi:hypothetical protein